MDDGVLRLATSDDVDPIERLVQDSIRSIFPAFYDRISVTTPDGVDLEAPEMHRPIRKSGPPS